MRKKWLFGLVVVGLLLVVISLVAGCQSTEKKMEGAKKAIEERTIAETPYPDRLYNNGKNFLFIEGGDWNDAIAALQPWVDEHPEYKIVAFTHSNDYEGDEGWLVYYERR